MAHTLSTQGVRTASPLENTDSDGNVEQRGAIVCGEVDITSYTNDGEVLSASELGLNVIYNVVFLASEVDTYAVRSFVVAAGGKTGTINIDTAGSGTEVSASTDVGKHAFIAFGEGLATSSN